MSSRHFLYSEPKEKFDMAEKNEPSAETLFRPEVLEEQGAKIFADTLILRPPGFLTLMLFFSGFFVVFLITLTLGSYERSVPIHGILRKTETSTMPRFEGYFLVTSEIASGLEIGQKVIIKIQMPEKVTPYPARQIHALISGISTPPSSLEGDALSSKSGLQTSSIYVAIDPQVMGNRLIQKKMKDGIEIQGRVITGEDSFFSFVKRSLIPEGVDHEFGGS